MTSQRTIITMLLSLVALTAAAAVPVVAEANPLLSGYGGPGEGSQALLGSALLNGPSGGGGSAGGGSAGGIGSSANNESGSFRYGEPLHGARGSGGRPSAAAGTSSTNRGGRVTSGKSSNGAAGAYRGTAADRLSPAAEASAVAAAGSRTLGLSNGDLLLILLALAVLALTGTLTARLTRQPHTPRSRIGT
jgi:hypothetical protein